MEWILGIIGLMIVGSNIYNGMTLTKIQEQQTFIKERLNHIAPRIARVNYAKTSHQSPGVDAKARTTQRDTDDLPLSGRQRTTTTRRTANDGQPSND